MSRSFKKNVILSTTLLFMISVVFCCHFMAEAQAKEAKAENQIQQIDHSCCGNKSDNTHQKHRHTCVKKTDILNSQYVNYENALDKAFVSPSPFNLSQDMYSQRLMPLVQPLALSSKPPIYLQNSVFLF